MCLDFCPHHPLHVPSPLALSTCQPYSPCSSVPPSLCSAPKGTARSLATPCFRCLRAFARRGFCPWDACARHPSQGTCQSASGPRGRSRWFQSVLASCAPCCCPQRPPRAPHVPRAGVWRLPFARPPVPQIAARGWRAPGLHASGPAPPERVTAGAGADPERAPALENSGAGPGLLRGAQLLPRRASSLRARGHCRLLPTPDLTALI